MQFYARVSKKKAKPETMTSAKPLFGDFSVVKPVIYSTEIFYAPVLLKLKHKKTT
jgi:hypothetical protein